MSADPATMATDPRVSEIRERDVDAVNERLARIEQIKRFEILDRDLTQADGELTPTLKVKRARVYEPTPTASRGLRNPVTRPRRPRAVARGRRRHGHC